MPAKQFVMVLAYKFFFKKLNLYSYQKKAKSSHCRNKSIYELTITKYIFWIKYFLTKDKKKHLL